MNHSASEILSGLFEAAGGAGETAVDRQAFDRLLLDHLSAAERFAVRLVGDPHRAEDLLHDALVRVARSWQSFRGESSFKTWFFQIIVNAFRDELRRKSQSPVSIDGSEPPISDELNPLDHASGQEIGEIVAGAVSRLPPRQREVLVLVSYEGMTPAEAARTLGITPQDARTNLHHARQRLRAMLPKRISESERDRSTGTIL